MPPSIPMRRPGAPAVEQLADSTHFRLAPRDKGLAAESGIDRHHEHVVEVADDLFERADGRRRIDRDAGQRSQLLDEMQRPMEVGQHLGMNRDPRRSGVDERLDVAIGVENHQVHVERNLGHLVDGLHDQRSERDVRHEMAVHDVQVQQVGATPFDLGDLRCQRGEIGREKRRRNQHAHRLTSIEIGSPGAI